MHTIIDLKFQNEKHLIGAFLIKTDEGGILIETGPYSCHESLKEGIAREGLEVKDIKKVFVSHIHLDHSGGAWAFAEQGAEIYVHPLGAPHLISPDKLIASATKIYGDAMEKLWSDIKDIPAEKVKTLADQEETYFTTPSGERKKIIAHHTPGHAGHHIAYQIDKSLFAGDVLGLQIENSPILMPSPPPETDLSLWRESLGKIRDLGLEKILLTHFGEINECNKFIAGCDDFLKTLEDWFFEKINEKFSFKEIEEAFEHFTNQLFMDAGCSHELIKRIKWVNPPHMTAMGFVRYFKKFKNMEVASD